MKKIISLLVLCFSLQVFVLAQESNTDKSFPMAYGPGLQFSILGIGPTITFDLANFEIDARVFFTQNGETKKFGVSPQFSLGYNSNPYEKGYANFIGASYYMITASWIESFLNLNNLDNPSLHLIGLVYNGAYQWNNGLGINFGLSLPFVTIAADNKSSSTLAIFQGGPQALLSFLIGFCTFNVGIKYKF